MDLADLLGIRLDDAPELRLLGKCPFTRVAAAGAFAVQRADLNANAACCKPRQPVTLKDARLPPPQDALKTRLWPVANDELEQHIGVRVDNHGGPVNSLDEWAETTAAHPRTFPS